MPTDSDTPCAKNFTRALVRLSSWKLAPFTGGWLFRDFLGDFLDLYDVVGLIVSFHGFVYPHYSAWAASLFPALAPIFRSGFF